MTELVFVPLSKFLGKNTFYIDWCNPEVFQTSQNIIVKHPKWVFSLFRYRFMHKFLYEIGVFFLFFM